MAEAAGAVLRVLRAVEDAKAFQKTVLLARIRRHFAGQLAGRSIAVWDLALKPYTDDMREAPRRVLLEGPWNAGASVRAYDPAAMYENRRIYGERADLQLCDSAPGAVEGADALAIVTEWQEFRSPDFDTIKRSLASPVIFDGRNLYDPLQMNRLGFIYYAIGRGDSLGRSI